MGIRNGPKTAAYADKAMLITPHGDSEHSTNTGLLGPATPHNPSWGFGTAGFAGGAALGAAS